MDVMVYIVMFVMIVTDLYFHYMMHVFVMMHGFVGGGLFGLRFDLLPLDDLFIVPMRYLYDFA